MRRAGRAPRGGRLRGRHRGVPTKPQGHLSSVWQHCAVWQTDKAEWRERSHGARGGRGWRPAARRNCARAAGRGLGVRQPPRASVLLHARFTVQSRPCRSAEKSRCKAGMIWIWFLVIVHPVPATSGSRYTKLHRGRSAPQAWPPLPPTGANPWPPARPPARSPRRLPAPTSAPVSDFGSRPLYSAAASLPTSTALTLADCCALQASPLPPEPPHQHKQ